MIVLIPARGQSKRIPRKNIKMLGGKPLIQWTIDAARQLPVKDVVVSTEDEEIAQVASALGATVLMRPVELASDTATDHDVVRHFLENYDCECIVYLRPTTPFRDAKIVTKIARIERHDFRCTSVRSVQAMEESAFKCFTRQTNDGLLDAIRNPKGHDCTNLPNQMCIQTYSPNGYADILYPGSPQFNRSNIFGNVIYGFITPPAIELDTPEQWAYAEYLIEKGLV
jgi:CMP-N-acetylneuraminic acid synthetase